MSKSVKPLLLVFGLGMATAFGSLPFLAKVPYWPLTALKSAQCSHASHGTVTKKSYSRSYRTAKRPARVKKAHQSKSKRSIKKHSVARSKHKHHRQR